jgi:hypothetical protein
MTWRTSGRTGPDSGRYRIVYEALEMVLSGHSAESSSRASSAEKPLEPHRFQECSGKKIQHRAKAVTGIRAPKIGKLSNTPSGGRILLAPRQREISRRPNSGCRGVGRRGFDRFRTRESNLLSPVEQAPLLGEGVCDPSLLRGEANGQGNGLRGVKPEGPGGRSDVLLTRRTGQAVRSQGPGEVSSIGESSRG